jgi:hypothetical protein
MSTSSVTALRKAIHVKLAGASALVIALGGTKIFDEAPRNAEPPYLIFADTQVRDWSSSLSRGAEHLFVIAVWSHAPPSSAPRSTHSAPGRRAASISSIR